MLHIFPGENRMLIHYYMREGGRERRREREGREIEKDGGIERGSKRERERKRF